MVRIMRVASGGIGEGRPPRTLDPSLAGAVRRRLARSRGQGRGTARVADFLARDEDVDLAFDEVGDLGHRLGGMASVMRHG